MPRPSPPRLARWSRRVLAPPARACARRVLVGSVAVGGFVGCGGGGNLGVRSGDLVAISTESLPPAVVGHPYRALVEATGPHAPLVWLVTGGRLPEGLALDAGRGAIEGIPRHASRGRVEIEVRDGPDRAGDRDASFAATRRAFVLDVATGPVTLLPFPCPPAEYGAPFTHRFEAVGGTPPYRFELASGALPRGLGFASDGVLRGVPGSASGTTSLRVRALDAAGASTEASFDLRVVVLPLRIATATLPEAGLGAAYAVTALVSPAGAGAPLQWAVEPSDAALPPGVRFDPTTARFSGVPVATGAFPFALAVRDAVGQEARVETSIRVNPGPVLDGVTPFRLPVLPGPVTLAGRGFRPGMTVAFGAASPVPADVLEPTRATVRPPREAIPSGIVDVTISNPDGGAYTARRAFRFPFATVEFVATAVRGGSRDHARGLAAGDVDGDGRCDLAHVGSQGIELLRATVAADGPSFATKVVRSDGSFNDVRLADVDADGDLDLVVLRSSSTDTIDVHRNDGLGGFPAAPSATTVYPRPTSFHHPNSLATGDLDGDGLVDVGFTSGRGNQGVVFLYRGLGDGTFVAHGTADGTVHDGRNGCCAPSGIALADLDGDGRDDVVVADSFPSACAPGQACPSTPLPNAYPGTNELVGWVSRSPAPGATRVWTAARVGGAFGRLDGANPGLALGDHDGDGRLDLAVFGGYFGQRGCGIAWLLGDGAGGFSERFTRPTAYDRRYGTRIDANGDGADDWIVVGGTATVAAGGSGHSVAECWLGGVGEVPVRAWVSGPETTPGGSIPGANPGRVVAGDFDGDGLDDFALCRSHHAKVRWPNGEDDGPVEGVAVYLNRSR